MENDKNEKKTYLLLKSTLVLAKFFFFFFFAQLLINGKINIANKSTAMFCCSLIEYYSEKKIFVKSMNTYCDIMMQNFHTDIRIAKFPEMLYVRRERLRKEIG